MILSWDRLNRIQNSPPSLRRAVCWKLWWWGYDFRDLWASWACAQPFHGLRRWMLRMAGMKIGRDSSVHRHCILLEAPGITLAPNAVVNDHVVLDGRGGLFIGSNASVSRHACIYTSDHDLNSPGFDLRRRPVRIEDHCFIGARALVLPGVTCHRGAVVAAGAVVTRDVAEMEMVAGVPARPVRKREALPDFDLKYWKLWG